MGTVMLHGNSSGNAALNVKRYESKDNLPTTGTFNEIAVITNTQFNSWRVSAQPPASPEANMLHIRTATTAKAKIDLLSGNTIEICIANVSQYKAGKWEDVPAYVWMNDKWEDLASVIYAPGNHAVTITGDWNIRSSSGGSSEEDENGVTLHGRRDNYDNASMATKIPVSLAGYSKLIIKAEATNTDSNLIVFGLCTSTTPTACGDDHYKKKAVLKAANTVCETELDITGSTSEYIGVTVNSGNRSFASTITVYEIRLE